jgi:hypothetical protein
MREDTLAKAKEIVEKFDTKITRAYHPLLGWSYNYGWSVEDEYPPIEICTQFHDERLNDPQIPDEETWSASIDAQDPTKTDWEAMARVPEMLDLLKDFIEQFELGQGAIS